MKEIRLSCLSLNITWKKHFLWTS